MESMLMDLKYAARRLRARPTYSLLAALTLALGVGGTAAVWGLVRGLLIEPLPYANEQRVSIFWNQGDWSEREVLYLEQEWPGFEKVAAYRADDVTLRQGEAPAQLLAGLATTAPLFDVLGVKPLMGRGLQQGDDRENAERVAVISHAMWQELGGSQTVVGSRLQLSGVPHTVVGVMPRGFWFPDPTVRVWRAEPLNESDGSGNYTLVGLRQAGATQAAMEAALGRLTARLKERFTYPAQWDKTRSPILTDLREHLLGGLRVPLLAVLAAMAVILLIACGNVAALMLGQVDASATEFAVRAALGADRRRMTQQLLAEALLVGLAAAGLGMLLATYGFRLLADALPLGALAERATLDWSVFFAALGIALLTALAVALIPATHLWRSDPSRALSHARTGGGRGGRLEGTLVVGQVALAVLLTAGAALLVRSVMNLRAIDPGVDTDHVAVVDITIPRDLSLAQKRQAMQDMVGALERLPGVTAAGATIKLPLRGSGHSWGIQVEGRPELASSTTFFRLVTPDYFRAMGISLKEGRLLERTDVETGERVVVVNQALAAKYFAGQSALGKRLGTGFGGFERIVGVVEDVAEAELTDGPAPARYMLYQQVPYMFDLASLVLRVDGRAPSEGSGSAAGRAPADLLEEARRAVQAAAPAVAVQKTTTLADVFEVAVGPARQVMSVLTFLTGLALVLGAVGIYGVTSQYVTRRRRDLGIRLALGLTPARVVAQVVGRGGRLVLLGSVVGTIAVLGLARLLASLLYGVSAVDPLALLGATGLLLLVGMLVALVPARRASRLDPAAVFREQ
jgi:putative ABC transport system permease protein